MSFDVCVARLIENEGGYKPATPDDPGGETKYGIAARFHPGVDIKNLTIPQATAIYSDEYWKPIRGGELPQAIAFQLLDFAVNSGPVPAIKGLQDALGVTRDGVFGPATLAAANAAGGPALAALVMKLVANRLRYISDLKNWLPNSRGWTKRVATNLRWAADDLAA